MERRTCDLKVCGTALFNNLSNATIGPRAIGPRAIGLRAIGLRVGATAIRRLFTGGPPLALKLWLLCLVAIALMVADHRYQHLDRVRAAVSFVLYPLQHLVGLPLSAGGWMLEHMATRAHLIEELDTLRKERLLLAARLQRFAALEAENRRLRELLDASGRLSERVAVADLVAVDLDPRQHQVLIDKGSRQGVFVGQPLLDAHGIIGQVVHTGPASATAILITDPNHAIPVRVNRTGLRAIALGTGQVDRLKINNLPRAADIEAGDLLVASGLGGRFPVDYPVAAVVRVEALPGQPFAAVEARPLAEINRSREVLLIWSGRAAEAAASAPAAGP